MSLFFFSDSVRHEMLFSVFELIRSGNVDEATSLTISLDSLDRETPPNQHRSLFHPIHSFTRRRRYKIALFFSRFGPTRDAVFWSSSSFAQETSTKQHLSPFFRFGLTRDAVVLVFKLIRSGNVDEATSLTISLDSLDRETWTMQHRSLFHPTHSFTRYRLYNISFFFSGSVQQEMRFWSSSSFDRETPTKQHRHSIARGRRRKISANHSAHFLSSRKIYYTGEGEGEGEGEG